jgi:integrase
VYAATQREAIAKLAKLQGDARTGRIVDSSKLTLAAYLDSWLENVAQVRRTTKATYANQLAHVQRIGGGEALQRMTKLSAAQMLAEMEREGIGARTRRSAFAVLKKALKDAVRLDLISFNPCEGVDAPKAPRAERKILEPEEIAKLLAAAEGADNPFGTLVVLLTLSGMRLGEALGLRWGCVDLARGTLRVERALADTENAVTLEEPKTAKSRRELAIPERAVAALLRHRQRLKAAPHPDRLVFTDRNGGPLRRWNLYARSWRPLLKAAAVQTDVTIHSLRHAHATLLLRAGIPVHVVSRRLGHSTATMTLGVYAHVVGGDDRAVAERVEALLPSKASS